MSRMPSDEQIREWGVALGHGPGPYPTKVRAQLAKAIQLGQGMETQARQDEAVTASFGARVAQVQQELLDQGLTAEVAGRVLAAVSPALYRETRGGTTA